MCYERTYDAGKEWQIASNPIRTSYPNERQLWALKIDKTSVKRRQKHSDITSHSRWNEKEILFEPSDLSIAPLYHCEKTFSLREVSRKAQRSSKNVIVTFSTYMRGKAYLAIQKVRGLSSYPPIKGHLQTQIHGYRFFLVPITIRGVFSGKQF